MNYTASYLGDKPIITRPYLGLPDTSSYASLSVNPWVRNPNWIPLPTLSPTDEKMVGLFLVDNNDSNYLALAAGGSAGYIVDWGDGVIESKASNAVAQHLYDYASINASTEYQIADDTVRQVIITITPQAGGTLTSVDLNKKHGRVNLQSLTNVLWVDFAINGPNLTNINIGKLIPEVTIMDLESIYVGVNNISSWMLAFSMLKGLKHVDIDASEAASMGYTFSNCATLKTVKIHNTTNLTDTSNMFTNCYSLLTIPPLCLSAATTCSSMFTNCASLQYIPPLDTRNVTTFSNMFNGCTSLREFPNLIMSNPTATFDSMFVNCASLAAVPSLSITNVASGGIASMFSGCTSLVSVGQINIAGSILVSLASMFSGCTSLIVPPLFSGGFAISNTTSTFQNCKSLVSIPTFSVTLSACTAFDSMFSGCSSLIKIPTLDTTSALTTTNMFYGCTSLVEIPNLITSKVTSMANMFNGCGSLLSLPPLDYSKVQNLNNTYQGCRSLNYIPNLSSITNALTQIGSTFLDCYSLRDIDLFDTSNVTSMNSTFQNCVSLKSVPLFDTSNCTAMATTFNGCESLIKIPFFNTVKCTSFSFTFNACKSLTYVPPLNLKVASTIQPYASTTLSLVVGALSGPTFSVPYQNCKFNTPELYKCMKYLGRSVGQTVNISGNIGLDVPITLTGTTSISSLSVTMANTTGLSTGMQVTGIGTPLTTFRALTFQDAGDTVTLFAHSLLANDEISFSTITSTTGIITNTIYYVINPTYTTFQVASVIGGAAMPLTTNGSGNIRYRAHINTIIPNTRIILTRPASSSGTNTLSFRNLSTGDAILKGWAVTG